MNPPAAQVSEVFVSIQGEGRHVGRRHLFIRLAGCPLRCRYCDSPESLVPVDACRVMWSDRDDETVPNPLDAGTLDRIVAARAAAEPQLHALAVTGGEPLSQAGFLATWLPERTTRLPVLLETAAIQPERLARVVPWVDIVSADIKLPSNSGEPARWVEHEACLRAAAGRDLYVKVLVDDGTEAGEVEAAIHLVGTVDPTIPVFLQPITDPVDGRLCIAPAGLESLYRRAATCAAGFGLEVRVLPQVHKVLGVS